MDTFTTRQQNDEAMRRGLEAIRTQGAALLEKEQAEAAERDRKAYAEVDSARADAENQAVELLRKLAPLYAERSELVKQLAPILERIYAIEVKVRGELNNASAICTPHWVGRMPDNRRSVRFAELRNAAGLPDFHAAFNLPATHTAGERLAATIAIALAREIIAPDVMTLAGKTKQFDSSAGF